MRDGTVLAKSPFPIFYHEGVWKFGASEIDAVMQLGDIG